MSHIVLHTVGCGKLCISKQPSKLYCTRHCPNTGGGLCTESMHGCIAMFRERKSSARATAANSTRWYEMQRRVAVSNAYANCTMCTRIEIAHRIEARPLVDGLLCIWGTRCQHTRKPCGGKRDKLFIRSLKQYRVLKARAPEARQ